MVRNQLICDLADSASNQDDILGALPSIVKASGSGSHAAGEPPFDPLRFAPRLAATGAAAYERTGILECAKLGEQ